MRVVARDLPHPVVFIGDPESSLDIPPDVSEAAVCATANCLSVLVQASIDGPVQIEARAGVDPTDTDLRLVFQGTVQCVSGTLSVSDAEGTDLITFPAHPGDVPVRLLVDNLEHPAQLVVLTSIPSD